MSVKRKLIVFRNTAQFTLLRRYQHFGGSKEEGPQHGALNFWYLCINPLKTMRICFIYRLCAYRAVNTHHFGYKNQSLNVL
jgi:hypothetical protein